MKKCVKLIALSLAVLLFAGCNLIATDPVLDAKIVMMEVGGQEITKIDFYSMWMSLLNQYAQQYGTSISSSYYQAYALEDTKSALTQQVVLEQKIKALGLDQFTEEEETALKAEAESTLDFYGMLYQSQLLPGTALEGEALTAALREALAEQGMTYEKALEESRINKAQTLLREQTVADVAVSEEEIAEEYDTKMLTQKDAYAVTPTKYGSDEASNAAIYYVPAGYRYIKHALINISAEAKTQIQTLESELNTLNSNKTSLEQSVASVSEAGPEEVATEGETPTEEGKTALTEEEKAERETQRAAFQTQLDQVNADIAAKTAELEAAKSEAFEAIRPKAQEVLDKAKLGLNFDRIVETYGEDPGMKTEPGKSRGYALTEGMSQYDPAFQEAAMALGAVGDISDLVQSSYGFHILQYASDSVEHAVDLADVREKLSQDLLTAKQNEAYTAAVTQWVADTKVKVYDSRIKTAIKEWGF